MKLARSFFWFGAAAVVFDMTTTFAPPLLPVQKSIVPFTGWVGSAPYIFALGMWPGLLDRGRPRMDGTEVRRHLRFTVQKRSHVLLTQGAAAGAATPPLCPGLNYRGLSGL